MYFPAKIFLVMSQKSCLSKESSQLWLHPTFLEMGILSPRRLGFTLSPHASRISPLFDSR